MLSKKYIALVSRYLAENKNPDPARWLNTGSRPRFIMAKQKKVVIANQGCGAVLIS
jgi:hypothetical protein